MAFIEPALALIVTISILVTIHELGHFWVARMCGVKVLRFSVGFGKPLFKYRLAPVEMAPPPEDQPILTRANENFGTEFVVAAIPLGGYVKMLDEREGHVADDELHLAFNRKPVATRIAIVAAGPLANFLLAILCYWLVFTTGVTGIVPLLGEIDRDSKAGAAGFVKGEEIVKVDAASIATWTDLNFELFKRIGDTGAIRFTVKELDSEALFERRIDVEEWLADEESPYPTHDLGLVLHHPAVIRSLEEGGRASEAGLKADDQVVQIDGFAIDNWTEFVDIIRRNPEQRLDLTVLRQGKTIYLPLRPARKIDDGNEIGYIGAATHMNEIPEYMQRDVSYPVYKAWLPAVHKTWSMTVFTLASVKKMIMGAISPSNLSGPITIARVADASAKSGLESYIGFIALLSISLGVLNLLPIPILDGGHLLYYFIELVRGQPVSERIQMLGLQLGVFLIVGIMLLAFYNDFARF
jgi:regulator of sigma E protease|tara:strand:- start:12154 stop:13557 length:1404 start_codon:yes stop_codon:yes gene_type:complete